MHSWSRVAEDLVRAARGQSLEWRGVTLRSCFQPIYSVRRACIVGYEALVRAADSGAQPIRVSSLFADVFASGHGVLLDWICRALHLRNFAAVDPGDRQLFINVHPEAAVSDASRAGDLDDMVRFYGLAPKRVCVEILEDDCTDEGLLREAVAAYRELGATIAMDDFGIGRSNFDRIVRLRPDVVKLDRAILREAVGDAKSRHLLPALVELLHESGARVVIEGIQNTDEALVAMDSGADHLQGYYFAHPGVGLEHADLGMRMLSKLLRLREPSLAGAGDH